ncbi:MAG: tetratricopeptide repeat protein [Ignavibacteriae bacterium]|nr:tetratricopeptide repeat protein [Ignavibacteriota bacterium]
MKIQDLEKNLPNLGPEERIVTLKNSTEVFKSSGDSESLAHALLLLGNEYRSAGEHSLATECFNGSAEIFETTGDLYGEAASLNNLGFTNKAIGDNQAALGNYEKALSLYRALGDADHEYIVLLNIAKLYFSMKEYLEAVEYYEDALSLKEGEGDEGTAEIVRTIAESYLNMGENEKAGSVIADNAPLLTKYPQDQVKPQAESEAKQESILPTTGKKHISISRGVRNYLTSIIGYSQYIKANTSLSFDEITEMMDDIEVSALTITELVNNIDMYEAMTEGKLELNKSEFNFPDIVSLAMRQSSAKIQSKRINSIFKTSKEIIPINSDKRIVLQILNNLISNAVRFTPPGKNIYAYVSPDGELVRCEIIDEGGGISEAEASQLLSSEADADHPGVEDPIGVGLVVAKNLAELVGGKLRCESMLGKGSAFVFELPAV